MRRIIYAAMRGLGIRTTGYSSAALHWYYYHHV